MDNTKNRKRKGKILLKNVEISGRKEHTNKHRLKLHILTITDVFLDQKRVNTCEHMVCFLLIKKDICDRQSISVKFPCVCVCLLFGDIFIFW